MRSKAWKLTLITNSIDNVPDLRVGIFLLFLLFAGCACKNFELCSRFPSGPLDAQEALVLLDEYGNRLTILDVRTDAEFKAGHVPGALHIPVLALGERMQDVPYGPVLVICRSGNRAAKVYALLKGARPEQQSLWYLKGKPEYGQSGFTFHD